MEGHSAATVVDHGWPWLTLCRKTLQDIDESFKCPQCGALGVLGGHYHSWFSYVFMLTQPISFFFTAQILLRPKNDFEPVIEEVWFVGFQFFPHLWCLKFCNFQAVQVAGFAENQDYGVGFNTWTSGQKARAHFKQQVKQKPWSNHSFSGDVYRHIM